MKIINNYSGINTNQNFKSLKINYNAQEKLMRANYNFISNLFEAGRKLEGTQFVDLYVSSDLKCRIQSKANPYFAIKEPIIPSFINNKRIKLNGVYAGKEDKEQGNFIDIYLDYEKESAAQAVFDKLKESKGLKRLAYLTRIIDNELLHRNSNPENENQTRELVVSILLDKYGDLK